MKTNSGYLVETKSGQRGRTYNSKGLVNNKGPVYLEEVKSSFSDKAILCEQDSLRILGFID